MKSTRTLFCSLAAVLALVATTETSFAQVVPFKASGDNAMYYPTDANPGGEPAGLTTATGKATHMGRVTGSGFAGPTGELTDDGKIIWAAGGYQLTASNGDQIFLAGGGTLQFYPIGDKFFAIWEGKFDIDNSSGAGGTGRFAKVKSAGPIDVVAINDPFELDESGNAILGDIWTYSWTLNGHIDLGKKRGRGRGR